jgi:predicted transglutaminase-like cysteine proteinase
LPPAEVPECPTYRFVNGWEYRTDVANYGRSDYWATPFEFFRRSGDCEDYAIAKYRSLRLLGLPADQLRMVVVQDVVRDLPHAVLAVYLEDEVYILDNQTDAVLPQARVPHYVPYYSVNEVTRWAHTPPDALVVTSSRASGTEPVRPARR